MRLIKMLGLAAVAAAVVMAFVGASTASATTLCKKAENPCAEANRLKLPEKLLFLSAAAVLTAPFSTVTCHSTVTVIAETNDGPNKPLLGKVTELKWSGCKGCTEVTTTAGPEGTSSALAVASPLGNGELTAGKTVVLLKGCPFGAECTATVTSATLQYDGGTIGASGTAEGLANGIPVEVKGSFGCSNGKWWANGAEGSQPYHLIGVDVEGKTETTGSKFIVAEP